MKKTFPILIIFLFISGTIFSQAKKDSIPQVPDSILISQYKSVLVQNVLSYVEKNFKMLTIQQYQDYAAYIDNLSGQVLIALIGELEKKKKLK